MNWLDVVLGLVVLWSVWRGVSGGVVRLAIGLASSVLAFLLAAWFFGVGGELFHGWVGSTMLANVLGFLLVFALVMIAGSLLARVVMRVLKVTGLSFVDRVLGGVFGLVRGVLVGAVLVIMLVVTQPLTGSTAVRRSELSPLLTRSARLLLAAAPAQWRTAFRAGQREAERRL